MKNGFNVDKVAGGLHVIKGMDQFLGEFKDSGTSYLVKKPTRGDSSVYNEFVANWFCMKSHDNHLYTWTGVYKGKPVIILENFLDGYETLLGYLKEYEATHSDNPPVSTEKVYKTFYQDFTTLTGRQEGCTEQELYQLYEKIYAETKERLDSTDGEGRAFWEMFVMDTILAVDNRYKMNWGYSKVSLGNALGVPSRYRDNCGALFPDFSKKLEEYKKAIKENREFEFLREYVEGNEESVLQVKTGEEFERLTYKQVMSRIEEFPKFKELLENAWYRFAEMYDDICSSVGYIDIPKEQKRFYAIVSGMRFLHLIKGESLEDAYQSCLLRGAYYSI